MILAYVGIGIFMAALLYFDYVPERGSPKRPIKAKAKKRKRK